MAPKSQGALICKIYFSDKKDDILQVTVCQSSTKELGKIGCIKQSFY